ncbi:MAG: type II secretion system protein GspK [Rhodocyclaceae bacterium]
MLILTIATLAILALAGAFIGERVSVALNLARLEQQLLEEERAAQDVLSRVQYTLATTRRTALGLGAEPQAIRLDGRWYDAGEGIAVSLQDARGLLNLHTAPRTWREAFLASYGLPPETVASLLDTLDDYSDSDSLRRLQGAEAEHYAAKGLAPPRNQPLSSVLELARIAGWRQHDALWNADRITDEVVLTDSTAVNPATAHWRLLVAAMGMPEAQAKAYVETRAKDDTSLMALTQPYTGLTRAADLLVLHRPVVYPSAATVITIARIGGTRAWRGTFTLTPASRDHAWTFTDYHSLSLTQPVPPDPPALPDMSARGVSIDDELARPTKDW